MTPVVRLSVPGSHLNGGEPGTVDQGAAPGTGSHGSRAGQRPPDHSESPMLGNCRLGQRFPSGIVDQDPWVSAA